MKTVNALKARKLLGQLWEEVFYKGDHYVIERAGRPMVAVVPICQLEEWQKRQDRFLGMVEEQWGKIERWSRRSLSESSRKPSARSGRGPLVEKHDPGSTRLDHGAGPRRTSSAGRAG